MAEYLATRRSFFITQIKYRESRPNLSRQPAEPCHRTSVSFVKGKRRLAMGANRLRDRAKVFDKTIRMTNARVQRRAAYCPNLCVGTGKLQKAALDPLTFKDERTKDAP